MKQHSGSRFEYLTDIELSKRGRRALFGFVGEIASFYSEIYCQNGRREEFFYVRKIEQR